MYIEAFPEEDDGAFIDRNAEPIGDLYPVGVRVERRPERRWKRGGTAGNTEERTKGTESRPIKVVQSDSKCQAERVEVKKGQGAGDGTAQVEEGTKETKATKDGHGKEVTESKPFKVDQSELRCEGPEGEKKQDDGKSDGTEESRGYGDGTG